MAGLLQSDRLNLGVGYVLMIFAFIYQAVTSFVLLFVPRWLCFKKKDITGQKVLITGAGSGVGRQLAVEFSKHATCLILVDINRQSLLQTEKLLDRRSAVFIYDCDVSNYRKVCQMAEKVKKDVGDVDILVNNAGVVSGKYLIDISEDEILRTMGVNALAHFWTVKAFLPAMMERNSGHVVSMVSIAGKVASSKVADYCSSKYAAMGFAECLEQELREQKIDGIKVTIVCPSHIDTGLFDGVKLRVGTTMTPEYVAKEVLLAVLKEQEILYLPDFVKFTPIVKECLPRKWVIRISELTGIIKAMETFTGRQAKPVKKD